MINDLIIRNFQLMKNIFANMNVLVTYYKLSKNDISILQELCMKHNSYNAYIECYSKDFVVSRRVFYRVIDKLENENIINVVARSTNQHNPLKLYFTTVFVKTVCGEDFATLYEKWLKYQKSYKQGDNND